jgi:hypothetical protein
VERIIVISSIKLLVRNVNNVRKRFTILTYMFSHFPHATGFVGAGAPHPAAGGPALLHLPLEA